MDIEEVHCADKAYIGLKVVLESVEREWNQYRGPSTELESMARAIEWAISALVRRYGHVSKIIDSKFGELLNKKGLDAEKRRMYIEYGRAMRPLKTSLFGGTNDEASGL